METRECRVWEFAFKYHYSSVIIAQLHFFITLLYFNFIKGDSMGGTSQHLLPSPPPFLVVHFGVCIFTKSQGMSSAVFTYGTCRPTDIIRNAKSNEEYMPTV